MSASDDATTHKRRQRYRGKNPRRFEEKYKEHNPARYAETIAQVLASGKTPAGSHRPIMVAEILSVLSPQPGEVGVDCTLGYGGHAEEILRWLEPGGRLLGLDVDPVELPKTEARFRALGIGSEAFVGYRSNFAGLPRVLAAEGLSGVDLIVADLGVSSMQLDNPARGFSLKQEGPLDNPPPLSCKQPHRKRSPACSPRTRTNRMPMLSLTRSPANFSRLRRRSLTRFAQRCREAKRKSANSRCDASFKRSVLP